MMCFGTGHSECFVVLQFDALQFDVVLQFYSFTVLQIYSFTVLQFDWFDDCHIADL